MSSLWTPGGEHPVVDPTGDDDSDVALDDTALDDLDENEAEAAVRAEIDEARQRLAGVPAAQVVANHAMGLFELAAIHLSQTPPNLGEATLAIDAMGAIVDAVGARLGENGPVLGNALSQIRMAFVQVRSLADTAEADQT
ncbi:MAG: hypothetical protein QOD72_567 [Acidimicrobiaceae bacterium]|jgi:hypothetical protein|nr:hypothetical protein [Acidimicrobiaceae bacterium]